MIGLIAKSYSLDLNLVAYLIIFGIILFSGSLYLISIFKISFVGVITPVGGLLLFLDGYFYYIIYIISKILHFIIINIDIVRCWVSLTG